jgi:hypothetical protein
MKSLKNNFIDNLPDSWLDENAIFEGNLTSICAKVTLDLNDPRLLVDIYQPNDTSHARRIGGEFRRRVKKDFTQKYNISNDEAYDLLNKITQRRVRSTLGQLEIEHSLPALKFQTPFVSYFFLSQLFLPLNINLVQRETFVSGAKGISSSYVCF